MKILWIKIIFTQENFIFKTSENCYTQKLLTEDPKNPQPRHAIITHRRVKEMFPFMTDVEYKISNNEVNF